MVGTVIVVGAGPAGLIAAGTAAKTAERVILIDKNDRVGKKLMITGKGRCNITNAAPVEDFIAMYPRNGTFLYSALYSFTNDDIVRLLAELGVKTKTERGMRVFPVSDKAADVVRALEKYARTPNTVFKKGRVTSLLIKDGKIRGVRLGSRVLEADSVIISTGGKSYPSTGSTGDGYTLAREAGHTIVPIKPSLVPLCTKEKWVGELSGLSLRNVAISAYDSKNKKVYSDFGEMLFTHFGVSGPIILSMSAHLDNLGCEEYRAEIDLKPALSPQQLDARILRDFDKYKKKQLQNSLTDLLPKKLIPCVTALSGVDGGKKICEITKNERFALAEVLKHFTLTVTGARPIAEAIITSGGVKTNEIDPSTMESKKIKGLYFAGEVIDVDGYTGGFNLQAAYSTGYLAGTNAALERTD